MKFCIKRRGRKMSKKAFTPGPWEVGWKKNPLLFPFIWQENGFAIAEMCGKPIERLADTATTVACLSDFAEPEKVLANANLIAAAPEMYEALKKLKECLENFFGKTEKDFFEDCDNGELYFAREYNYACNVLKKARGEE